MAASSLVAPTLKGFQAEITDLLRDPISKKPIQEATVIFPCGHIFDRTTLVGRTTCPLDEQPIEFSALSHKVRTLARDAFNYQEGPPPLPEEADRYFARGKQLLARQEVPGAFEAFRMAHEIDPSHRLAGIHYHMSRLAVRSRSCLANASASIGKKEYLKDLDRIGLIPGVQRDPDLLRIIEEQLIELTEVDSDILPPEIQRKADWILKLRSEDKDIGRYVTQKLKQMFPLRAEGGPAESSQIQRSAPASRTAAAAPSPSYIRAFPEEDPLRAYARSPYLEPDQGAGTALAPVVDCRARPGKAEAMPATPCRGVIRGSSAGASAYELQPYSRARGGPAEQGVAAGGERLQEESRAEVRPAQARVLPSIYEAARMGDHVAIERALSQKIDINAQDENFMSPLHYAASGNHVDCVRLLQRAGADLNGMTDGQLTPLHCAVMAGNVEAVRVLIELGALVDPRNNQQSTPLYQAVQFGIEEAILPLLQAGADPHAEDYNYVNPVSVAALSGWVQGLRAFAAFRVNVNRPDRNGMKPIHLAIQEGHLDAVNFLLGRGVQLEEATTSGMKPLHVAISNARLEIVGQLLYLGARPDSLDDEGVTPLFLAARTNNGECIRMLANAGADFSLRRPDGSTALHEAARGGCREAVVVLIELETVDPKVKDQSGNTAAAVAAAAGHAELAKEMKGERGRCVCS